MAKAAGRLAVLKKNSVAIGGVKSIGIKGSAESIDVTDRDSNSFVEYLSAAKTQQITLEVEGWVKDSTLRDIFFDPTASKLLTDITFQFADALAAKDTIAGNFFMSNYEEQNPHDDAADFKCTFSSSGAWTFN